MEVTGFITSAITHGDRRGDDDGRDTVLVEAAGWRRGM